MKMFKRFAAALLVGVMALAMLTACVDSTSKIGKEFEDKFVAALNVARGAGAEALRNDDDLRTKALGQLYYVKGDGTIAAKNADVMTVLAEDKEKNTATVLFVSVLAEQGKPGDEVLKVKEITAEVLKQSGTLSGPNASQNAAKFQKIGIATREVNGKTYAAAAYEMEVNAQTLETLLKK